MRFEQGGYMRLGHWQQAPLRIHWSAPLFAMMFGQFQLRPFFWLAFIVLLFIHEHGHIRQIRRFRLWIESIEIHGLGGKCKWGGRATPLQRSLIAWGGIQHQILLLAFASFTFRMIGPIRNNLLLDLHDVFVTSNFILLLINLLPFRFFDGGEAWKLPRLLYNQYQEMKLRQELVQARAHLKQNPEWQKRTKLKKKQAEKVKVAREKAARKDEYQDIMNEEPEQIQITNEVKDLLKKLSTQVKKDYQNDPKK